MNAITTRRSIARQPVAPPAARQPVAVWRVMPIERKRPISTKSLGYIVAGLWGAFVGAWLMGLAG